MQIQPLLISGSTTNRIRGLGFRGATITLTWTADNIQILMTSPSCKVDGFACCLNRLQFVLLIVCSRYDSLCQEFCGSRQPCDPESISGFPSWLESPLACLNRPFW